MTTVTLPTKKEHPDWGGFVVSCFPTGVMRGEHLVYKHNQRLRLVMLKRPPPKDIHTLGQGTFSPLNVAHVSDMNEAGQHES
jgi:hypothetical protein